jgi:hypothetical protein
MPRDRVRNRSDDDFSSSSLASVESLVPPVGTPSAFRTARRRGGPAGGLLWLASFLACPGPDTPRVVLGAHGSAGANNRRHSEHAPSFSGGMAGVAPMQSDGAADYAAICPVDGLASRAWHERARLVFAARFPCVVADTPRGGLGHQAGATRRIRKILTCTWLLEAIIFAMNRRA